MRRYEILLPLRFNDGTAVPESLLVGVVGRLRTRFGAVSFETQTIRGLWEHEGRVYRDELVRLVVDVPDTAEIRDWFCEFKEGLKVQFRQVDIWVTSHLIDVL